MERKKRILIVDDEPDFTWMLKLNLDATGLYDVRTENIGVNAVAAAHEFSPDLVLLDLVMPHMTGGQLAAQIEGALWPKIVPIIFLTAALPAHDSPQRKRWIAGYRFLSKPVTIPQLLACIADELKAGSPAPTAS